MKKLLYIAAAGLFLTSCGGTKEYDAYVASLKAQPTVIDTISTPQSYAVYLDSLSAIARDFEDKGVKLDEAQKAEISSLGLQIQEALVKTYDRLAQTPATLPDSIAVPE